MKTILKQHDIAGFTILESLYPPHLRQPRHTHARASFSFVMAGSYLENYGRQTQVRQPSTFVFHPPQEAHAVGYGSKSVRILSVHLDCKRLAYIREHSLILDSPASHRSETIVWLGHRIYQEFSRLDAVSALAVEGLVFEILAEASRIKSTSERKSPSWLEQVKEFLHDNFSESFVMEDVAEVAGVHPVHLARVFREQHGLTIGEYVRRLRLEFARQQISTTETPLSEIAVASGFSDQSHLTRTFRSVFGLTPSRYRKISRKC